MSDQKVCHTCILRCHNESLYTGITFDLERRFKQHNGQLRGGAKYTKMNGPVELIYSETYDTHRQAAQREAEIKKLSRIQKEALLQNSS